MYFCKSCNYSTSKFSSFKIHQKSIKHLSTLDIVPISTSFKCNICNTEYTHKSSLYRHQKKCNNYVNNNNKITNIELEISKMKSEFEFSKMKNELEYNKMKNELEIEKLKNELNIIKNGIEIKSVVNNSNNTIQNNIVNNVKNVSKIENLNINFGDVIDINTFIENYKNEYGLTNKQTEVLLINYKENGINSCISSLVYYLKESAIQQYKELKGKEITMANIILPFILSDKYLRDHFEKTINGNWDKTTVIDNIKRIIGITDDHVFKHQKTYMHLSDPQKKKLVNGLLKASGYSKLALISDPNLYKIENNSSNESVENL